MANVFSKRFKRFLFLPRFFYFFLKRFFYIYGFKVYAYSSFCQVAAFALPGIPTAVLSVGLPDLANQIK